MNDAELARLRDDLATMPEGIHDLIVEWPPGTKVTSHEDHPLMFPAPGIVGYVVSYFEDGNIGVLAPAERSITSPITGETVKQGEMVTGECKPEWLVFLEHGPVTPDDVRACFNV